MILLLWFSILIKRKYCTRYHFIIICTLKVLIASLRDVSSSDWILRNTLRITWFHSINRWWCEFLRRLRGIWSQILTLLGPQSRFGDKLLIFRVCCTHIWECGSKRVNDWPPPHPPLRVLACHGVLLIASKIGTRYIKTIDPLPPRFASPSTV